MDGSEGSSKLAMPVRSRSPAPGISADKACGAALADTRSRRACPSRAPLLRSRLQAELLTLVLLSPGWEWTLTELAGRVGSSVATAQREVTRAEQTGVITSRRLGNTRLVTAATSPLTEPLTELMLRSFGPRHVVAEELAGLPRIGFAFLFGSLAARYEGQHGRPPADIDVLVIGTPDRDDLDDAAQRAPRDWPARST